MPLLLAGTALFAAMGFAADQTGDAVKDSSDGLIKLAIVGGVMYIAAKKMKVI